MNMVYLLSMCDKSYIVEVLLLVKSLLKILFALIPIIIIIATIINLVKAIKSGNDEDLKENWHMFVRRVIAGLIIFFIPMLVSYAYNHIAGAKEVDFLACFDTVTRDKLDALKAKEKAEEDSKNKAQEKIDEKEQKESYEKEQQDKEKQKKIFEEEKKKEEEERRRKEEEERRRRESARNDGNSAAAGSIISSVTPGTSNLIIGDSRTVGMCATMVGDWSKCSFSNGGAGMGEDFYISQGAMSYSWFKSTAVPAVNQVLANNPNTKYNIYSLMGVNNLMGDIDKYIALYNSLANGEWKDQKIILVSVTPVNEAIEAQHGYSTKNSSIENFNARLKNGVRAPNVSYCDVYTQIKDTFGTADGIHYNARTYKDIYDLMKQC